MADILKLDPNPLLALTFRSLCLGRGSREQLAAALWGGPDLLADPVPLSAALLAHAWHEQAGYSSLSVLLSAGLKHSLYELTNPCVSRRVWASGLLQSEDDACVCLCFLSHRNPGTRTSNLQQSAIQTTGQTNRTHHTVTTCSHSRLQHYYHQRFHDIKVCVVGLLSSPSEWQCVMWVITGPSMWLWLVQLDPAPMCTLCLWTSCSWNMIISSSELFYMYSETKGDELASCLHRDCKSFTLWTFVFLFCCPLSQVGHLVVHVWDAVQDFVELNAVEGALRHAERRDSRTRNTQRCTWHTHLHSVSQR